MLQSLLSLKAVESYLDDIKLFEVVNKNYLDKLINSEYLKTIKWNDFDNEKCQLEEYMNQLLDYKYNDREGFGLVPVKYKRGSGLTFGRVYPLKSLSLCAIRKEVRHTISTDIFVDIDITNCHPELLYQTLKANNIECNILEDYVKNRDKRLKEVMDKYNVDRDSAKALFIMLLYFGSFKTWLQKESLDSNLKPLAFITKFIKERDSYGKIIEDNNEDIYLEIQANKTRKGLLQYNEKASVVSIWCQEIENRILEIIFKYCQKKKYIKDHIAVLCYDGIMLERKYYNSSILNEFTNVIKEKFGYELKYVIKELDKGYNILLDQDLQCNGISGENSDDFEDLDSAIDSASVSGSVSSIVTNNDDIKKSDREFFKKIKNISHADIAKVFYTLNKSKYIYSSVSKWWKYNEYNVLENTGSSLPIGIQNHITECLVDYLIPIRNRMKPNSPSYTEDCRILNKLIKDVGNAMFLQGVTTFLQKHYYVNDVDSKIDNNPNLLAFSDKVFDKSSMVIRDIEPDDCISKTTNYKYGESNSTIRTHILDIIKSIFNDDEMEQYFLNIKAQGLFGNVGENCFIQVGLGGNGKGLMSTIEKYALGAYTMTTENTFITSVFKQGQANSTLASTRGIRNLVISEPADTDEFQRDAVLNTAFTKLITGGDEITTRQLYKDNISFKPHFTPFIQCNNLISLKRIDAGIMRRIKVIKYPFMFVDEPTESWHKQKIYELKSLFETVNYYREYLLILLDTIRKYTVYNNVKIPKKVTDETEQYFIDNNPVKNFIDSFIVKQKPFKIKSTAIKEHFDNNSEEKMTMSQFLKAMKQNGYDTYMSMGYRWFKDINISNSTEIDM